MKFLVQRLHDEFSFFFHCRLSPAEVHDKSEKVSYAKRMAQGYLKSVGMGEWTPKINTQPDSTKNRQASLPNKAESGNAADAMSSKWKNFDDDQDFDF